MKRAVVFAAVMVMLLLAQQTQAGVSLIMNGSFESDGIINDITVKAPRRWCDVNLPSGQFGGKVETYWSTHGDYSLILFSKSGLSFAVGDMATVSQDVYLMDVNQIIFDIELSGTHSAYPWQSEKFSAIVLIDGNVVWDSNDWVPDGDGVYTFEVNGIDVNDENLHTLSLVMKANKDEYQFTEYRVRWDFVKFDAYCGGFGYLPQDLNYDCYVDMLDLKVLTEQWLAEELNQEYDLFRDDEDIINFPDFAAFASYWQAIWSGSGDFNRSGTVDVADLKMFAEHWLGDVVFLLSDLAEDDMVNFKDIACLANRWRDNTDWKNWQDENCFELELPAADLDYDGIVNFRDFAILAGDWRREGVCIRGDIERDKVVDYKDISRLADEWLLKSWLYGLE